MVTLRAMAQTAVEMDKLLREHQKEKGLDVAGMRRNLIVLQEQLSGLKRQMKGQYEAFALDKISKTEYLASKAAARQKELALSEQIAKLESAMEQAHLSDGEEDGIINKLRQYTEMEAVTKDVWDDLLMQVLVFPGNRIEIQWRFQDEFDKLKQLAIGIFARCAALNMSPALAYRSIVPFVQRRYRGRNQTSANAGAGNRKGWHVLNCPQKMTDWWRSPVWMTCPPRCFWCRGCSPLVRSAIPGGCLWWSGSRRWTDPAFAALAVLLMGLPIAVLVCRETNRQSFVSLASIAILLV